MKTFDEAIDKLMPLPMRVNILEWREKFRVQYDRSEDILNSRVKRDIINTAALIMQDLLLSQPSINAEDIVGDMAAFGFACLEIGIAIGTEMEKSDF